jgi:hypothetical protein
MRNRWRRVWQDFYFATACKGHVPPPSMSNMSNASLNSAISSLVKSLVSTVSGILEIENLYQWLVRRDHNLFTCFTLAKRSACDQHGVSLCLACWWQLCVVLVLNVKTSADVTANLKPLRTNFSITIIIVEYQRFVQPQVHNLRGHPEYKVTALCIYDPQ